MLLSDRHDDSELLAPVSVMARRPSPPDAMEGLAVSRVCGRGDQIYGREDPVDCWYRIVSGMARKSTIFPDGRRRIVDFLLPDDFFGFSAREQRYFDVEAVSDGTVVAAYSRRAVEELAETEPEVGRLLRNLAFESISRLQARILILGRVTAVRKVGAFLLEMAARSSRPDLPLVLTMSRYDIADYLALSVETVSRAITHLQGRGCIALLGKHEIKLLDRDGLG
ncbi:MAG TPA: helix-turn-helix domain-containing protein [Alphaproteobacteria bacterium]